MIKPFTLLATISLTFLSSLTLSFPSFALECSKNIDGLEQIIHVSKESQLFPQRLDNRILGRFKASKGFYVFESRNQMILGLDLGILGKKTYPVRACLAEKGWIQIHALYEGKNQTVMVRPVSANGRAALELKNGTGPLKQFQGIYPRENMNLKDIERMFLN